MDIGQSWWQADDWIAWRPMVLFVSYAGLFGGAERLLIESATALEGEVALACPEGALAHAAAQRGLRWLPLRARGLAFRGGIRTPVTTAGRLTAHGAEIRRLSADLDPELVVLWGMRSAIAWLLGLRQSRSVAFQHNDFLPGRVAGSVVRWTAQRTAVVTVPSRSVAADLDPRLRLGSRLKVIHPGVRVDRFSGSEPPAHAPEVLVLGAVTDWKRPDLAIEVCARVRRTHPDLRLRLVGGVVDGGDERLLASLRDRALEPDLNGALEISGPVDDPVDDLARATCLLHCADREPFGLAVLEALAAGRPAIVPAGGGPTEIVDSTCGALYPPGNAGAAARVIVELLDDPARATKLGAAGRERARRHFDMEAARSSYAAALRPLRHRESRGARPESLEIVTVTYNSAPELSRMLRSVERHLPGARIIVVDCGSEDETVAHASACDSAVVLALGDNVGFGQASNRGVAVCDRAVAAMLNPDVELVDDSLLSLAAEALHRDRPERLLAPMVLNLDGSRQDSVHPAPGSAADLVRSVIPPTLVPGPPGRALSPWQGSRPRRVGWAVGCALVARLDTWKRLGPFDEQIFLYGEDLELGLRAHAAGVATWFWPSARVLHEGAHSTRAAFGGEPLERLASARRDAVRRALGPRRAALDDAAQAVTFASRLVLKRALGRPATRERRQLQALVRARREPVSVPR